jgi:hypothetical protein
MANTTIPEEVLVLRFFETASIEKVEAVFNIVCEKMRERLADRQHPEVTQATRVDRQPRGRKVKHNAVGSSVPGEKKDIADTYLTPGNSVSS